MVIEALSPARPPRLESMNYSKWDNLNTDSDSSDDDSRRAPKKAAAAPAVAGAAAAFEVTSIPTSVAGECYTCRYSATPLRKQWGSTTRPAIG